jgi:hypothetical protein
MSSLREGSYLSVTTAQASHVGLDLVHAVVIGILLFDWHPDHFFSDLIKSTAFSDKLHT